MLSEDVEEKHYARFEDSTNYNDEIARVNEIVDGRTHARTHERTENWMPMSNHASRCDKNDEN